MTQDSQSRGGDLFIVDNSETDWKVQRYLRDWTDIAHSFDIATGYFEIGALLVHSPPVRARRAVPQPLPAGAYFVTICTRDRECLFGHVVNSEMRLNEAGEIAQRCWEDIPGHFPFVELDAFVIMPNHVHGIIVIQGRGEKSFAPTYAPTTSATTTATAQSPSRAIGSIVRGFKIAIQGKGEASVPPHVSEERPGSDASPLRQRPNGT